MICMQREAMVYEGKNAAEAMFFRDNKNRKWEKRPKNGKNPVEL